MEDETLNNILNLLQNATGNNSNQANNTTANRTLNDDIQNLLIKFLLSGGLNQIINMRNQNNVSKEEPQTEPEKLRTIDLSNYQRLD